MSRKKTGVHPTAIIDPTAVMGRGVTVGPYSIIGPGVTIGDDCGIMHHVIVDRNTRIGSGSKLYPFCSIGTDPQDVTYQGEETRVMIGKGNVIREFTQINRGTAKGGGDTVLGDENFIMAYSHIGHDCRIGNHAILINGATLAGHVEVADYAVIGAFSSVHQFVRIGDNAYVGGYTIVLQDVLPYSKMAQSRDYYNFYGPNAIGMRRCGMENATIHSVREMFRTIFQKDFNTAQAVEEIRKQFSDSREADLLIRFIRGSRRGILKNFQFRKNGARG